MSLLFFRSSVWPRRRKNFHQKLYSRHSAGCLFPIRARRAPNRRTSNNNTKPLYCSRNQGQPPLLLIVPEHACRCGYSLCRGFIVPKYASEAKVDGDEALHLPYLYYFLRSDAKTGFGRCWLSAALRLMILAMAAWTLGASAIP